MKECGISKKYRGNYHRKGISTLFLQNLKRLLQNFAIQILISNSGSCQQAVNLVNLLLSSFVASCTGSGFLVPDILKVTLQQYINMQTAQFDERNHD